MLLKSVALRYAQALFQIAQKHKQVDDQLGELVKVDGIVRSHPNLERALESPTIPVQVKKAILRRLLTDRVKPVTMHFFFVLVDKNREVYVRAVIEAYKTILREQRGELEITVVSAQPLDDTLAKQIALKFTERTGKKVELKVEHDPELLGGIVILVGDKIIDGSLRGQLTQIQERFRKSVIASAGG